MVSRFRVNSHFQPKINLYACQHTKGIKIKINWIKTRILYQKKCKKSIKWFNKLNQIYHQRPNLNN